MFPQAKHIYGVVNQHRGYLWGEENGEQLSGGMGLTWLSGVLVMRRL